MSLGDAVPFGRAEQRVGYYGSIKVLRLSRACNITAEPRRSIVSLGRDRECLRAVWCLSRAFPRWGCYEIASGADGDFELCHRSGQWKGR